MAIRGGVVGFSSVAGPAKTTDLSSHSVTTGAARAISLPTKQSSSSDPAPSARGCTAKSEESIGTACPHRGHRSTEWGVESAGMSTACPQLLHVTACAISAPNSVEGGFSQFSNRLNTLATGKNQSQRCLPGQEVLDARRAPEASAPKDLCFFRATVRWQNRFVLHLHFARRGVELSGPRIPRRWACEGLRWRNRT